jgi:putative membrane protein
MRHTMGWLALVAGFTFAFTLTGAAQDQKDKTDKTDKGSSTAVQGEKDKSKLTKDDAKAAIEDFFKKAASAGALKVQLSRFAMDQARREEVKKFAQKLMEARTKSNQELLAIAQRKGITIPQGLLPKDADVLIKVGSAKVGDFEVTYVKAQIESHDAAVKLLEALAKEGSDPEFKAWAEKTLTSVRELQKEAQALSETIAKSPKTDEPEPKAKDKKEKDKI